MNAISAGTHAIGAPASFAGMPGDVSVSFELFPPANDAAADKLVETARQLALIDPAFVSMTYGAGGTGRERSLAAVRRLQAEIPPPVAAHLTCVGASRSEINRIAEELWQSGVRHIVALRGDCGEPGAPFEPHPDGYRNAAELVAGLRQLAPFEVSVAAYPEVHPDAASAEADLDNLKRKIDAGASRALTQFFFDPDHFFRFRDRAAAAGIDAPIVPGILPVTSFTRTRSFAASCGTQIPDWLETMFAGLDDHPAARPLVAASVAAGFCQRLYDGGVRDFHFYTLNRADVTQAVCHLLGRRLPAAVRQAA